MANIEIVLGPERLLINEDTIDVAKARQLRTDIKQVAKAYDEKTEALKVKIRDVISDFYPRLEKTEEESDLEWEARTKSIFEEREAALALVSPEDKESYIMELAFECLKVISTMVGQGQKVTQPNFEKCAWAKLKLQLAKLLISNECELGTLFLPPKTLS